MQLQVIDPNANFSCGACAKCCTQPWAILIEKEKIPAIQQHDFSKYPRLSRRDCFFASNDVTDQYMVVSKQDGSTRCTFLDEDGLCIIHKELGAQAKPIACQKFPYHVSHLPREDRVSLSFACPSAQAGTGVPLVEQHAAIKATCEPSPIRDSKVDAVMLQADLKVTTPEFTAIMERLQQFFARQELSVWSSFDMSLGLIQQIAVQKQASQTNLCSWLDTDAKVIGESVTSLASPVEASRSARMLFAGNMLRDVVPASVTLNMSLWGRITLLPRLMTLVKLSGVYESKLLGRRLNVEKILQHPVNGMVPSANALLKRYIATRLWQRFVVGNRLSIAAGLHQHVLDTNAVIFLARALAVANEQSILTEELVASSLSTVEFNIANQSRVFDHPSLAFFTGMLDSIPLALESLRMFAIPVQAANVNMPISIDQTGLTLGGTSTMAAGG